MSYNTCTEIEEKNEVYVFEVMLTYDDSIIIKRIIKNIETAEQVHIFFVESVNIIKLNGTLVSI
jgi:hypothetical protein